MRKLLLLCTMLLSGIGAWAQITDVAQLSNEKCYHITSKDAARGAFYAAPGATHLSHCGGTHSGYHNKDVAKNSESPAQQFALIKSPSHSDRYYLYSVSENDFANWDGVKGANREESYMTLDPNPSRYVTIVKNGDYFNILADGQNKLNFSGGYRYGVFANYNADDDGNKLVITEAADFVPTIALARIKMYEGLFPVKGLGYPKESSTAYTNLVEATNGTDKDAYNTALAAYYNSTDVEMPVSGKAYYIKAWWRTDGERGMTYANNMFKPTAETKGVPFVYQTVGTQNIFVADNGYYLGWEADGKDGYTDDSYDINQKFTIEKATSGGSSNVASDLEISELLGKFCLKSNIGHYLMFGSHDSKYHNGATGSKYYGHTNDNTVFFVLEEVTGYKTNTVKLSAQFEGETCISTFYAPYATVLPEEYTAHKATKVNTATVHLEEIGTEIPANTGVFVTGPANEKVVLSLSTNNPASLSDNLLDGSAVDTYVEDDAYVLAKPTIEGIVQEVGLYKAERNKNENGEDGTTHFKNNAGKAYLPASAVTSDARFLVFSFGDDMETGITETENGNVNAENAEVYDLAGRRVQNAQKGIFIVNGKKVVR